MNKQIVNKTQKNILIDFMKNHENLQSGKFSNNFTYRKAQQLWQEVTIMLNSVAGGASKDWKKWRRVIITFF